MLQCCTILLLPVAIAAVALCGKAVATASAICILLHAAVVCGCCCNLQLLHVVAVLATRVMPLPLIVAF